MLAILGEDFHGPAAFLLHAASSPALYLALAGIATAWFLYLKRPDLGRRLDPACVPQLQALRSEPPADVALVLSDGLSATAVHEHGLHAVQAIAEALAAASLSCSPVILAERGRVALSDEIGHALPE